MNDVGRFEASACQCAACTEIVLTWTAYCSFCLTHCHSLDVAGTPIELLPLEQRIGVHVDRMKTFSRKRRDDYIRHVTVKFGVQFARGAIDPVLWEQGTTIARAAWEIVKRFRRVGR